jgi:tetratricopeptide (TPR) repeat protein
MSKFFVPVIGLLSENSYRTVLYRVEVFNAKTIWTINGNGDQNLRTKILPYFTHNQNETPRIDFVLETERKEALEAVSEGMQSIFLGVFLGAAQHIEDRKYKESWYSITVTGDVRYNQYTSTIDLTAVTGIEEKFKGVQSYAREYPGERHLFIYVSDETPPPVSEGDHDNIRVKVFSSQDTIDRVIDECFTPFVLDEDPPWLDAAQRDALNHIERHGRFRYIPTEEFNTIERTMLHDKHWRGYLIHDDWESGKTALADALARLLLWRRKIYAPIWITLDDAELRKSITDTLKLSTNTSQLINLLKQRLAPLISGRLDAIGPKKGEEKQYLLVINDLKLNYVKEVLSAVERILSSLRLHAYVLLTSYYDCKDPGILNRLDLKSIHAPTLTREALAKFIESILWGQSFTEELQQWKRTKEYDEFIQIIFEKLRFFPGILSTVISRVGRQGFPEALSLLKNIDGEKIPEAVSVSKTNATNKLTEMGSIYLNIAKGSDKKRYLELAGKYLDEGEKINEKNSIVTYIEQGRRHLAQAEQLDDTMAYIEKAMLYFRKAWEIAKPEQYPEEYADAKKGYAEALNHEALRTMAWKKLMEFLEEVRSDAFILSDKADTEIIGDIYTSLGDYKNRSATYFEEANAAYEKARNAYSPETDINIIRNINIKRVVVLTRWSDVKSDIKKSLLDEALSLLADKAVFPENFKDQFPLLYADKEWRTGDAYLRKSYFEQRKENASKAIEAYRNAGAIYKTIGDLVKYGRTRYDASTAYASRYDSCGDFVDIKQAVETALEALSIFKKETYPIDYASSQNYLGNAYAALLYKEQDAAYFDLAVAAYQAAAEVYCEGEDYPFWSGRIKHNIGELHRKYAASAIVTDDSQRAEYLKRAIKYFDDAVKLRTAGDYPTYYCITLLQEGRAYLELARLEPSEEQLQNTLRLFDAGITVCPDNDKLIKARLYENKGLTLEKLYLLTGTKNLDYKRDGITHIRKGLEYAAKDHRESIRMEEHLRRLEG